MDSYRVGMVSLALCIGALACHGGGERAANTGERVAGEGAQAAGEDEQAAGEAVDASRDEDGATAVTDDFLARVRDYDALRERLAAEVGRPDSTAGTEERKEFESALRAAIAEARSDASRGTMLSERVESHFREIVRHVLDSGAPGATLQAMIEESPGPEEVPLDVNARYPEDAMLSTVPPSLLQALPRLPEDLQYRFVGCRLLLLDAEVSIIVDYADECLW